MPRNMSFAMTTGQFRARTKTVTRRFGWWFLKPGDIVCGVEKAMGLKKGEQVRMLGMIRIVSTRPEPLNAITKEDCVKEGFPYHSPEMFVRMLTSHYGCSPDKIVNRIEFEYLPVEIFNWHEAVVNAAAVEKSKILKVDGESTNDGKETHFRPARTVHNFADGSELVYLLRDHSYVWQRPEDDPRYLAEVAILAGSDEEAVMEVMRAAQAEEIRNYYRQLQI